MLSLADIELLFARHGAEQYSGEPVTQLEHALQTAHFAEQSERRATRSSPPALLHDLGHLLNDQGETPTLRGIDDTHQYFALPFLRGLFADAVLDAIKLHVDAKRYLCRVDAELPRQRCRTTRSAASPCRAASSTRRRPRPSSPSPARATPCGCASGTTSPSRPTWRRRRSPTSSSARRALRPRRAADDLAGADLADRRGGAVRRPPPRLVERTDQVGRRQGARHGADPPPRLRRRASPLVLAVGLPKREALPWLAASLVIHVGYYVTLVGAYKHGDLGFDLSAHARLRAAAGRAAERQGDRRAGAAGGLDRRRRHQHWAFSRSASFRVRTGSRPNAYS